jgi:hypothetical protein
LTCVSYEDSYNSSVERPVVHGLGGLWGFVVA